MYIKVVIFTKKMAASHSDAKVPTYVQLWKMKVIPLVSKPYVNEVTLNIQNLY